MLRKTSQPRPVEEYCGRSIRTGRMTTLVCRAALCGAVAMAFGLRATAQTDPPVIIQEEHGRLTYEANSRGDRVPDFSNCGYAGANRAIPVAPVRVVVAPRAGDSTARVQKALDYVGSLPPDAEGVRGAVLLLKGRHEILGGLKLTHSGVVLRGQGLGEDGTALVATGLDRRTLIRVLGRDDRRRQADPAWEIADDYVPVGARSFHLKDAKGLGPGEAINIIRPCTQEWIDELGATEFGGGQGDFRLTWKPGSRDLVWDRVVESVEGNLVTVDAPVTMAIEGRFGGGRVETYSWPGRIRNVGIENLRLESAYDADNPKDEAHSWFAITMENAVDAWARQVAFRHFAGSAVAIYESCKQTTVMDCLSFEPISEEGGYRRHTFFTMGQLTLFLRCYAEHGRHDFSAGHCAPGPNAFVQCEARLPTRDSGPIESWSCGALYDNVRIDGNGLSLGYRGPAPNGAGWSAANSVLWNCAASLIRCQNPPTAQNWAFGSWAEFEGDGIWRGSNNFMAPRSLYEAQLRDRLGERVASRLKLMPAPQSASSNPSLDRAQELAAASSKPAPLLSDFILSARRRDPIPSEPGNAEPVESVSFPGGRGGEAQPFNSGSGRRRPLSAAQELRITNGWITAGGSLSIGGEIETQWWRGNIRPDDAPAFGPAVTRFAPGRIGRGLTDDLDEVADFMETTGRAAFDHHFGLWHDRRRDDHQRVRRMTGDVWPPFYEQPFARSGRGAAWDGLSKYDLEKFNPWYWSRLKQFADRCAERGLALFHQHYFQHNVLEAGAHWADFPWRSANNINDTGFPEPPPYAGDKRIFMAEPFYDATHPVRRRLHEGYIRQCLDNFALSSNVIHFTSAEFTGPQSFMEFWLDTIAEWEEERRRRGADSQSDPGRLPQAAARQLIALSCTKDVQDAILADPRRSALVDVIDFRYWWRTDQGEFAPPGGKNLAPRQFERRWRGGRPDDAHLAEMAAEYRTKFPGKALICHFESAGWAWTCAGGSMPRLPKTTDKTLLAAIPRMQPWAAASKGGSWVLREAGKQLLVYRAGESAPDLSEETGRFRARVIDVRTGEVAPREVLEPQSAVKLPDAALVWLTKVN